MFVRAAQHRRHTCKNTKHRVNSPAVVVGKVLNKNTTTNDVNKNVSVCDVVSELLLTTLYIVS